MKLKFKICDHTEEVAGRKFPFDGYLSAENNEYIYVFTRIPNYRGKHCKAMVDIYDKAMGIWYADLVPEKIANKVVGFRLSNKLPNPIYVKNNTNNNIVGMMKHSRKKKKSSVGRYYENPLAQTQELCHRGYTDESHWTGIIGSRLGHFQRYV